MEKHRSPATSATMHQQRMWMFEVTMDPGVRMTLARTVKRTSTKQNFHYLKPQSPTSTSAKGEQMNVMYPKKLRTSL